MWIKQKFNKQWVDMVHQTCSKYPDKPGDVVISNNSDTTSAKTLDQNYLMKIISTKKERAVAEALKDTAIKANEEIYGFNIWYDIDIFQYTTYKSEGQMEYDWHSDSLWFGKPVVQKLTIIVGLTNKDEYEGGDLVFHARNQFSVKLTAGQVIAFPSMMVHKVTPVTKGTRNTLVAWFKGPRWM